MAYLIDIESPAVKLQPPQGKEWFGWIDKQGYRTINIDEVKYVGPSDQSTSVYAIILGPGLPVLPIPIADAIELKKRLGWRESKGLCGATGER